MIHRFLAWLPAIGLAIVVLANPAAAYSASDLLELEAVPPSITLSPRQATPLSVIVKNKGEAPLRNIKLTASGTGHFRPLPQDPETETMELGGGEAKVWRLSMNEANPLESLGSVVLFAEYQTQRQSRVANAEVALKPPSIFKPEEIASFDIQIADAALRSGQDRRIYAIVSNKYWAQLRAGPVEVPEPEYLSIKGPNESFEVDPGEAMTIPLTLKVADEVRPGKYPLVFSAPVQAASGRGFDLTTTKQIEVGVAGEADLLAALGIPLILVSGFVIVATVSMLWKIRLVRREWNEIAFPLEIKGAEFWVVTIVASILFFPVARWVGVDLLDLYGNSDLITLFVAAFTTGCLVYVLIQTVLCVQYVRRVPDENDKPIGTLVKLDRAKLSGDRPRQMYATGGGSRTLYLLEKSNPDRATTWMSPRIDFHWISDRDEALALKLRNELDGDTDLGRVAKLLRSGVEAGVLSVNWAASASPVQGPIRIPKDKFQGERIRAPIVEER